MKTINTNKLNETNIVRRILNFHTRVSCRLAFTLFVKNVDNQLKTMIHAIVVLS